MMILNLTQHAATQDQLNEGVIDSQDHDLIKSLLTFPATYTFTDLSEAAKALVKYVLSFSVNKGDTAAMIGGMPSFMPVLQQALLTAGVDVYYARSERVSKDEVQEDGSVRKVAVFQHKGFYKVEAPLPVKPETNLFFQGK